MTKEFEIGINLLKRVQKELEELSRAEDKLTARKIVNAIINPVTASAYQIKVGSGPYREALLENLFKLVREMRELSDLEVMKDSARKVLELLPQVDQAVVEKKEA